MNDVCAKVRRINSFMWRIEYGKHYQLGQAPCVEAGFFPTRKSLYVK